MALAPGARLGPYEIVSSIGAGGMGEVYRARDPKLGREVAIKVLPAHLSANPEALARFEREAKAVATLSHPNILAIFDFGAHEGTAYAVMELLEGETLRERLGQGALGLRKALEIGAQVAQGLAAAHDKGIVHRDLKPDNVFVSKDGAVKLLDFGLARQGAPSAQGDDTHSPTVSRYTDPGTVMGTVGYMSPEQVRGAPVDHRSDIFSFGALLYEMLGGRRAFQRDTAAETMTAILKEEPADLGSQAAGLPPGLERIVGHCLEKRPEERFQSARDLAFDLQALMGSAASGARPVPTPSGRRRLVAPTLALFALAAAFVAGRRGPATAPAGGSSKPPAFQQLTDESGVEGRPSLSPDAKSFVYVSAAAGNSDVYLLRVGGRNPLNLTADSTADDLQPAFSPDGERIAFRSERDGGGVFVMDSTGESVRRLTDFGYAPAWSPDGKQIVVSTDTFVYPTDLAGKGNGLRVVTLETGAVRDLTGPAIALQPRWSPGGKRVAYWGLRGTSGQRDVWTIAADGSEAGGRAVAVTNDAGLDWCPVWAPDGRHLYFASDRAGSMNLWRVPIDEASGRALGPVEPLTLPAGWSGAFSVSADGRRIAFETLDWRSTLMRVPFDPVSETVTGPPVPVLRATQPLRDHEVSPDGQEVAFTRAGTREDLFVARMDGSQFRRLTDDGFRDRGPAWAPDGHRIAFYSDRGGGYEIWTIRPDGSGLEAATALGRSANFPTWSPDGRRLVFSSTSAGGLLLDMTSASRKSAFEELPPVQGSALFWPFSWSRDGRRLAGLAVLPDGRILGIAVYSIATRSYDVFEENLSSFFRNPRWLGDGQRLLVRDAQGIRLLDTRTRKSRLLLSVGGYMIGKSVGVTADDRWITFTETAAEGDVWLAGLE